MAGREVVILVEEQLDVVDDHLRTLDDLKSKICRQVKNKEASPVSSSVKLHCPKVPKRLLGSDVKVAEDYYAPKVISLGPYHHGKFLVEDGETLKLKLAAAYIQEIRKSVKQSVEQSVQRIYDIISRTVNSLRSCYDAESTKKYSDEEFSVMMLVDGCALVYYILCVYLDGDPEDYDIRYQDISLLHQDALLLENQLPYQLLVELTKIMELESDNDFWTAMFQKFCSINDKPISQEFFNMDDKESFQPKMKNYCCRLFLPINQIINGKSKPKSTHNESKTCHHLLHLFRRNLLGDEGSSPKNNPAGDERSSSTPTANGNSDTKSNRKLVMASVRDGKGQVMASFRNVKELMAAGIRIKPSPTHYLRDISFSSNGITACLKLPPITIDNSTKAMFFNLIAFEMSSDVPHDFISYLRFLDSLIDHADDIEELESVGVLLNNLGTHKEVALFFNTVSANLKFNSHAYKDVRVRIRKHLRSHYNSKLRMWITQCLDTYFASPWTIIAWVGAALALFFTAVQTYSSVFPH